MRQELQRQRSRLQGLHAVMLALNNCCSPAALAAPLGLDPAVSAEAGKGMAAAINAQPTQEGKIDVAVGILRSQKTLQDRKNLADGLAEEGVEPAILFAALERLQEPEKSIWPWVALGVGAAAFAITAGIVIYRRRK